MITDKHWLPAHTMQLEVKTDLGWLAIDVEYARTDEVDNYAIDILGVTYNNMDITDLFDHDALADKVADYEYDGR